MLPAILLHAIWAAFTFEQYISGDLINKSHLNRLKKKSLSVWMQIHIFCHVWFQLFWFSFFFYFSFSLPLCICLVGTVKIRAVTWEKRRAKLEETNKNTNFKIDLLRVSIHLHEWSIEWSHNPGVTCRRKSIAWNWINALTINLSLERLCDLVSSSQPLVPRIGAT